MALDGGGGGGGPIGAGNSFTGPSTAIEVIGNYVYAYSGAVTVNNSETPLIGPITTGNYTIVGNIQFYARGVSTGSQPSPNLQFKVKLNGAEIMSYATFDSATDAAVRVKNEIIIPPYTIVECTGINAETSADVDLLCTLNGRLLR